MAKLAAELKMNQPFALIQQEAALSLLRTADRLVQSSSTFLRPFDLTPSQFNVLRILRGSPDGLSCGQIAERMINRDPDITRLLDRMEKRQLLTRERSSQDRRVVLAKIGKQGLELLLQVDPVVTDQHRLEFQGITEKQMRLLIDLLEKVRESLHE